MRPILASLALNICLGACVAPRNQALHDHSPYQPTTAATASGPSRYLATGQQPTPTTPTPFVPPTKLRIGILGKLAAIHQGITTARDLKVCLEMPPAATVISQNHHRLDTQLAFAAWFAAGQVDPEHWQKISFHTKARCDLRDTHYLSQIYFNYPGRSPVLAQLPAGHPNRGAESAFTTRTVGKIRESHLGITYGGAAIRAGLGSAGSAIFKFPPPRYRYHVPSYTVLSNKIDFVTLHAAIDQSYLTAATKSRLLTAYNQLAQKPQPSYNALNAFVKLMTAIPLITGEDPRFRRKVQRLRAKKSGAQITFRPNICYFHVLVHEIGHQFGLLHHPDGDSSVMGASSKHLLPTANDAAAMIAIKQEVMKPLTSEGLAVTVAQ